MKKFICFIFIYIIIFNKAFSQDSLEIDKKIDLANQYYQKALYEKAIETCEKALLLSQEIGYKKGEADAAHRLGSLLSDRGKHEKALALLLKAVQIREKLGDELNLAKSLNNIGAIYQEIQEYEQSLVFMQKALKIMKKCKQADAIALITANIGYTYAHYLSKYDSAFYYIRQSLIVRRKIQDRQGEAYSLNYLGGVYELQKDYNKALQYYIQALSIEERISETYLMTFSYQNIGNIYIKLKKYPIAKENYQKAEKIAKKIGASKEIAKIYKAYAYIDSIENNFQSAYRWQILHQLTKDSIFNVEKSKQIAELQTRFELSQKEHEIDKLSQKNYIQSLEIRQTQVVSLSIIIVVLLLTLLIYLYFYKQRLKNQYLLLQTELRWRRSQMNPHFFFNALNAIQDFVSNSDTFTANSYIAKFAKLMRTSLEQSQEEFVSLATEIDMMRYYLDLQQLRFKNKFSYQILLDKKLEIDELIIPVMFTQPLIENAIEHGFKTINEKGLLLIELQNIDNQLVIKINDNGSGINYDSQKAKGKHKSMSGGILKNRIELLKKYHNFSVTLTYKSNQNLGTSVDIVMPLKFD